MAIGKWTLAAVVFGLAACGPPTPLPSPVFLPEDVLTREEIQATGINDLAIVVRQLRSHWSLSQPDRFCALYYVNERVHRGTLADFTPDQVAQLRYVRPGQPRPDGRIGCRSASIQIVT